MADNEGRVPMPVHISACPTIDTRPFCSAGPARGA
jgi:hypothetical protein